MESSEREAMRLRENTDARSVVPPSSAGERSETMRPCNNNHDLPFTVHDAQPTRELAARESDGIRVQLLWSPDDDVLTVVVDDERFGDCYRLAVAPDRALDAYYHPFAYAA